MRFVLVTALFALLIVGTSLPAAAAGASDHIREKDIRDRTVVWSDGSPKFERQRVARATTSDTDEDYEARPRQRYQSGDEDRPRAAKRQHAGKAKHARRHQHAVRRTARKVAHRDGRRQRRADTPAWTRRSLGERGPRLRTTRRRIVLLAAAARRFRRLVQPQRDDRSSPQLPSARACASRMPQPAAPSMCGSTIVGPTSQAASSIFRERRLG